MATTTSAEKSRLMDVNLVEEATETGINDVRKHHFTLEESSPSWIFRLGTPAMLLVVPVAYIALLGTVVSLDDKKQSSFGDNTLEVLQLAATLWPISFAAVLGPLLNTLALFSAERGATLGSLEFLLTGQTTVATFRNLFTLRLIRGWTLGVAALWCLSPVGGQAIVRSLSLRSNTQTMEVPAVHYFSQTPLLATYHPDLSQSSPEADLNALYGSSSSEWFISSFRRTVLAAFSGVDVLLSHANGSSPDFDAVVKRLGGTPQAVRLGQQDQWQNVRIPFMEYLPEYNEKNSLAWTPVPLDEVVPYSSFIGVPIRGGAFSRAGNSSMVLQSRYQIVKCGQDFDGHSWLSPNESEKKVMWHNTNISTDMVFTDELSIVRPLPEQTGPEYTSNKYVLGSYPNIWLDLVKSNLTESHIMSNDLNPDSYLQIVVGGNCTGETTHERTMLRVCNITTSNVDVSVNCTRSGDFEALECRATQVRQTNNPRFSTNLTDLSLYPFVQGVLFEMPFTTASYFAGEPSLLEKFLHNPPTIHNDQKSSDPGCFTNLSQKLFEARFATALNTFLMATYNATVLTGADGTILSGRNSLWHNTTATWSEFTEKQYVMNVAWFCVSVLSTLILLACTIANVVIRRLIVAPDFLGSIDGLTRDSPYVEIADESPYVGSGTSAGDRLQLTKNINVQIRDVQPEMDVGRIALTTELSDSKLDLKRAYC